MRLKDLIGRLFVRIVAVFAGGGGYDEGGRTITREDFSSDCMGNVREIVGGGAR